MASPVVHVASLLRNVLDQHDDTVATAMMLLDPEQRKRLADCLAMIPDEKPGLAECQQGEVRYVQSSDSASSSDIILRRRG